MAPSLILLMSSGSKKKEPRYICLIEAKALHSHRMWAVSSSATHLLHNGLSDSPIRRCLLRVLCALRRPVTTLYCVLLQDRNLALAHRVLKLFLKLVFGYYQDLATIPNAGKPTNV
jgi:hypothetical protein